MAALFTRPLIGAIALVTVFGVALSLSIPLLAIALERQGVSSTVSGLNVMMAGVANVMAVPFVPGLARRFGVRRLLAAAILVAASSMLLFWALPRLEIWFVLRFVFGAATGTIFVLSEFWINAAAPAARRGFVMGVYATALGIGFALGPTLLAVSGTSGLLPFALTAGLILLGIVPLVLAGSDVPDAHGSTRRTVLSFVLSAPSATLAALMFGAIETGAFSHLAVHGIRAGFSEQNAALLISAFTLGSALMQIPLGALSDRVDRRRMLLALGAIATVFAGLLPVFAGSFWALILVLLPLGGITGAFYTVGLAHLGSRYSGADLASANAAFVMLYSIGLMLGPVGIGWSMDQVPQLGLPLAIAGLCAAYTLLVGLRMFATRNVKPSRRSLE